jgi:hypothetical protein
MISIMDYVIALEGTQAAIFVSHSSWIFPAFLMIHVTAVALVVGMIAIVDLRLLGFASRKSAVSALCREVLPWTWAAFAVSAITGAVLFLAQPVKYFGNFAFQMKFAVLVLAAINMLVFQLITYRGVAAWDRNAAIPLAARLAGAISLLSWIAVVAYGRWTAYFMA